MKPTTRYWKNQNLELLRSFKVKARKQAWQLKKDGYIVEFYDRYKKIGWRKLEYSEIYNFEIIRVFEFDGNRWNVIIDDISYNTFTSFHTLVQNYKREYGKKKLHDYTSKILKNLK